MTKAEDAGAKVTAKGLTRYRLDTRDRIIEVSGDWDRFAHDNGADELTSYLVIGVPLRKFISGDVTRMFIDTMHARARLSGQPMTIPYRCDSPGVKRFMEMSLTAIGNELVSEHRLLAEHAMHHVLDFRIADEGRPCTWTKRCSMCNRLTAHDGRLLEPDDFAETGRTDGKAVNVIYHICPDCRGKVRARLER